MMRDVLQTHRDVGLFGIRHRTWMIFLGVLVGVQFLFLLKSGGGGGSDPSQGSLQLFVKSVSTKRVALVMPLHTDQSRVLLKRFASWNDKRFPCQNRREHHMMDLLFYLGPGASQNQAAIDGFLKTEARTCFRKVEVIRAAPQPPGGTESEETFSFYRVFDHYSIKSNYDVFFYMSSRVSQVKQFWADKIYEEAVLSDAFWVKGSAAMQTCPKSALTPDGDCDGSINLSFPAVIHINMNALYAVGDVEFDHLRARAEKKHPNVEPDVAIFQELVSTDHPLTNKIAQGGKRKLHAFRHHEEDPALSGARNKGSHHTTSLYWAAHIHRYRYTDFVVNAMAGKRHFRQELLAGHHANTFLVHTGFSE